MITIPEIIIKERLEVLIRCAYDDYNVQANKQDSLLYQIFGNLKFENLKYLDNIYSILQDRYTTKKRKLTISLGYKTNPEAYPCINIILPKEDYQFKQIQYDGSFQFSDGTSSTGLRQIFNSSYDLLITSDSASEVIIIYHFLKSLILMGFQQFTMSGLTFQYVEGRDIELDTMGGIIPNLYHRTISLTVLYENHLPVIERYASSTLGGINGKAIEYES